MAGRPLISERDILDAVARDDTFLSVPHGALITSLARDAARKHRIELRPEQARVEPEARPETVSDPRTVAIGSDHGGYDYKQALIQHLIDSGWRTIDLGTDDTTSVDYPDYAYAVARGVITDRARFGIMIDGAGIGSSIVCNKIRGIRAACAYNEFTAWNARAHNDANVLTLGSRTLGIEVCKRIVAVFLNTDFEGGRHSTRVGKIADVEARSALNIR